MFTLETVNMSALLILPTVTSTLKSAEETAV